MANQWMNLVGAAMLVSRGMKVWQAAPGTLSSLGLGGAPMAAAEPTLEALRAAIQLACQPQNADCIIIGRQQVLEMPGAWVLERIEGVASEALNLGDYWEYRRLLELAELLDSELVKRLVPLGLSNGDPNVREAAEDYAAR